ncbi:MAG: TasA family protein [Christensenellales bacterium]|jgi:predicted ribosomally synthesized peptide with SipW-like signal peptide
MKKKVLITVLAAVLLVALAVGGTLAWLTDTASVTNVFTLGDVKISLDEENWVPNSKIVPGAEIAKDPVVTVEANSEECYVFVEIDVPAAMAAISSIDIDSTNWLKLDGEDNVYYYKTTVASSTSAQALPAVFTEVTISEDATNAQIAAIGTENSIIVTAYAIQATAGDTPALAWAAL